MEKANGSASRRSALKKIAGTTTAAVLGSSLSNRIAAAELSLAPKLKVKLTIPFAVGAIATFHSMISVSQPRTSASHR
jgi:hypothetical protein